MEGDELRAEGRATAQGIGAAGGDIASVGDAGLVTGMARGRDDPLAELYRRHGSAVYRLARRLCGPKVAEDLAQEVFLALWRAPEAFDPGRGSLRSYLLVRAHGLAVDLLRKEKARRAREAAAADGATDWAGVEAEVLARMAGEKVWSLLSQLPEASGQAIVLAYFGGHTYRQVAALVHRPEGTVKSHIRTGLARLRDQLPDQALS